MINNENDEWTSWADAKEGIDYYTDRNGFRCDIKGRDPKLKAIIKQAEKEAEEEVARRFGGKLPAGLGLCHSLWGEQKRILKEKHNIDWKTPAEMNPYIIFD